MRADQLRFYTLLVLLLVGVGVPTVSAHQPVFNHHGTPTLSSPFPIDAIDTSLALYGTLKTANAVDYYRIDVPIGHRLDFHLFTPNACDDSFRPEFSLIGADIDGQPAPINLDLPQEMGINTVTLADWGLFFEPFGKSYYDSGPQIQHIATANTYYIAVYDTEGKMGVYLLSMAGREEINNNRDWREQKAQYDSCELLTTDWFQQMWQHLTGQIEFALSTLLLHQTSFDD